MCSFLKSKVFSAFLLFYCISASASAGFLPVSGKEKVFDTGRIFIINAPAKTLAEFKALVQQVLLLKPYGKVKVNISTLADKAFHEIPAGGSPWHEYASSNPTPFKFFPDEKLAPFLPVNFIKKNRELILAKAAILKQNGLEAAFLGYEPNFMPIGFFEKYPGMLGPRVDHPRRSSQKEFAPCIMVKETQQMYAGMMAELLKNVPEITSFVFKTNDAGAGVCWSDWLYSGPNGNMACKNQSAGARMNTLLNTFKTGAQMAGKQLSIYLDESNSNYSAVEKEDIERQLPDNCYFFGRDDRNIETVGSLFGSTYPVTGLINPITFSNAALAWGAKPQSTIFVNFRAAYDRGLDRPDMEALVIGLISTALKNTTAGSALQTPDFLHQLYSDWAGAASADKLMGAFTTLNDAFVYKSAVFPMASSLYWGVTMRLINRPLVAVPNLLAADEERYFLPYIFNVSEQEARMDYMDLHGGRHTIPPGAAENFVARLKRAAGQFASIEGSASQKEFFTNMATSLRIYASIMRSCGNFAAAQVIRDRDSLLFAALPHWPSKASTWTGHPDYIAFNNIMRDELDNTQELIDLLANGGSECIITAKEQLYEDRFILGPGLSDQLKKKRQIMLAHWLDIEKYMASPLK